VPPEFLEEVPHVRPGSFHRVNSLHFYISDGNSPLGSEGLPYALPSFEVQGMGFGWKPTMPAAPTEKRQNEMPVENEVVRFP
jgi:hypothetical protein